MLALRVRLRFRVSVLTLRVHVPTYVVYTLSPKYLYRDYLRPKYIVLGHMDP